MWNVEERFSPKAIEGLAALGFSVGSTRGVVRVEKYGCGAEFRRGPDERYQMTIAPTIMLKGQFTRVWDAGYQKFLLTDDGLKIPALASHLQNLRVFKSGGCSLNGHAGRALVFPRGPFGTSQFPLFPPVRVLHTYSLEG